MSLKYVDEIALQENIDKTKEAIETARAGLDAKKADVFQVTTMPQTPTEGQCVQYLGTTTVNYTYGSWYQYQEITPSTDPKTYHWVEVTQPVIMDSTLDIDSTNGIQNQAVTNALQALQNGVVIMYANESALPSLVNYAGGVIVAVGSVAFCVAEKTWHKVTAINSESLAITWSAFNPNIALEETSALPIASVDLLNKCYLLIGTQAGYDLGKIYQCQAVEVVPEGTEDPSALGWYELVGTTYELSADTSVDSSKTYYEIKWVSISSANLVAGKGITIEDDVISADTNIFSGTLEEWEALTSEEQAKYDFVATPEEESEETIFANNAGAHNSIYRGKYLGSSVTAEQYAQISAGTFKGMYIGDYWTIGGVNYRIASFNYWLRTGDTECTKNHIVLVPDTNLYTAVMNDTNVVTGAYVGSKMYTTNLATAKSTINSAFGSAHVLNHREYLKNTVSGGYETVGAWYDSTVELMTEEMVYGGKEFKNAVQGTNFAAQYTISKSQLNLFTLDPSKICNRASWWLRDIATSTGFACVYGDGTCGTDNASGDFGVRPAFGIIG